MVEITEVKTTDAIEADGIIYPDADFLKVYRGYNIAALVSAIAFETMTGNDTIQIGDSGTCVLLKSTGHRGKKAVEELKTYTKKFVEIVKESIPSMSLRYAKFYKHFMEDFDKNGLVMPSRGKIL